MKASGLSLALVCAAIPASAQDAGAAEAGAHETGGRDAEPGAGTVIAKAESQEYGPHISDEAGRALYTLDPDADENACKADCRAVFKPVGASGRPLADRVLPGLIGNAGNEDSRRVTFRGHELYRYVEEAEPGQTNAQGLNGVAYLVSVSGEIIRDIRGDMSAASGPFRRTQLLLRAAHGP
ncbi:COG4315 family predicted lipoprotein [Marinivivus vitaminiproducens]|uniref:COG4315 family predicted lipoprotein n=1 Tax=Marinivivus vitaminiproducens TaxID=3035935 RepID=UPI0027A405F7|nr:hypothetical protein P4R82_20385 [Geminicoccaceae bacterium SCSIO 64248]